MKNGTTFFRLFADVGTIGGLRAAQGLLLAREKFSGYCEIQVVAFPQEGIVRDPGAAELLDEAMKEGCDIVGGLPWYEYTDAEAREHIDICFDIAKRYDRDIHMLVDDTDDENSRSLEYLALKTMRENFHGRVAASHCGAMAAYNDVYAAKIVDMVATAGVTISVNAHINLVCSARLDREPRRRGIARVKELLIRGANVVTSQDDVNDPYYPFGKPDPLECVSMIAHVAQLTLPHELEQAMSMVTENAAKAARVDDYGIAPGKRADLVVVGAPSVHEAIRLQPLRRHVIKGGREVARSVVSQELLKSQRARTQSSRASRGVGTFRSRARLSATANAVAPRLRREGSSMSFVGLLKRVDATMRGSAVKDFNLHRDIRSPSSGLVAFTGRKLPIVLLPYEDCRLPNIIGPRQSTKRSRLRPRLRRRMAASWPA